MSVGSFKSVYARVILVGAHSWRASHVTQTRSLCIENPSKIWTCDGTHIKPGFEIREHEPQHKRLLLSIIPTHIPSRVGDRNCKTCFRNRSNQFLSQNDEETKIFSNISWHTKPASAANEVSDDPSPFCWFKRHEPKQCGFCQNNHFESVWPFMEICKDAKDGKMDFAILRRYSSSQYSTLMNSKVTKHLWN